MFIDGIYFFICVIFFRSSGVSIGRLTVGCIERRGLR